MPPKKARASSKSPSRSPARSSKQKESPPARAASGGKWLIDTAHAQTFSFSSEGMLMYPLSRILCPPLRKLGVTPNQITLFNILVGLGSGYGLVTKNWAIAWVFNFGHQLLDAMDGTMARMFNLQTDLGAKLDEFTDIFFGAVTALGALYSVWPDSVCSTMVLVAAVLLLMGELYRYSGFRGFSVLKLI